MQTGQKLDYSSVYTTFDKYLQFVMGVISPC
jgi:hypothetical protein